MKSVRASLRAAVLALALLASPVLAQEEISTVPENLLSMVGEWRLEQEDQSLPTCSLIFTEDQLADGSWIVEVPTTCRAPFPPVSAMAAWDVDEIDSSVLIMSVEGVVTMRLIEGEDGLFVTAPDIAPAFYLMMPWDEDGTGGEKGDTF